MLNSNEGEKIKLHTFQSALTNSGDDRIILLGNGFSIAWNSKIFTYRSLKETSSSIDALSSMVFQKLDTFDFEEVVKAFENAAVVCECAEIPNKFRESAVTIKNVLINSIAENHPDTPSGITEAEFESCVVFLSHFRKIFTLNYDMLLYWVLIRDMFRENEEEPKLKQFTDGFAYNDQDFLNWDGSSFDVHYLHGALHLFEESDTVKLNYNRSLESLKSQFIHLIQKQNMFPLFVAEGESKKKTERIRKSGYLTKCLNSFRQIGAKKQPTSLFTYGVSFSDNDKHICEAIADNNCQQLYVGIYGDPTSQPNRELIRRTQLIAEWRKYKNKKFPLGVNFFDAESARIWR